MKKNKIRLKECFLCFCSSRPNMDVGAGKCQKQKLPRKKKKRLKSWWAVLDGRQYRYFMDGPTSCDLLDQYNAQKKLFRLKPLLIRYAAALDLIWRYAKATDEGIHFDENGRLSWYWESDDDFTGGSSGVMPFCYSDAEAGRTWAFSEVEKLLRWLQDYPKEFVFPSEVKSDRSLIEYVHRNLNQFTKNACDYERF